MMEPAKAIEEHRFLEKLVGTWNVTSDDMKESGQWTEVVRSLHGAWFVAEGNGQMPDGSGAASMPTKCMVQIATANDTVAPARSKRRRTPVAAPICTARLKPT